MSEWTITTLNWQCVWLNCIKSSILPHYFQTKCKVWTTYFSEWVWTSKNACCKLRWMYLTYKWTRPLLGLDFLSLQRETSPVNTASWLHRITLPPVYYSYEICHYCLVLLHQHPSSSGFYCTHSNLTSFIRWLTDSYLHVLGKLRCFIIDVSHADPYCSGACARDIPFINGHHYELIQMIGPLVVQRARGENGPMRRNGEVWAQGVIRQLCILLGVTVSGRH